MKDSEKTLLIVLAGIAVIVLSFLYVMKPNWEETQALKAECTQLQDRLTLLQQKEARRDEYLAGIEEYEAAFQEEMEHFAPDLNQEVTIMFLEGIKDNNEFDISTLGLGAPEQFYTLGTSGADTSLAADGTATADPATTEAATTDVAATEAVVEDNTYECYRASFPITYSGSYESLKDVIRYVNEYEDRMTINSIDIAYAADADLYSGNIEMKIYSIQGPDRPETSMELNEIETGAENIFKGEGGSGSSSATEGMTKYDENDGAAIESSYDFYAMLNAASSDVSAKVVGQNGAGKEASVISNSDNDVTTLTFDFYEKDGKNYCKYTLGSSVSYEAEVTSAEDIKLLLQSSARKNDDDKVGLKVTIRNTTKLPVYVKVAGDDSVSPRVNVVSKSGAVKVY
ncbi:MAG: hypothetical protein J6C01_04420 [Lachnospiraceae bacterium]|nr:hypothetical protein [Lachnospiraceae bacterium]